jgi:hypothetical protein
LIVKREGRLVELHSPTPEKSNPPGCACRTEVRRNVAGVVAEHFRHQCLERNIHRPFLPEIFCNQ